MSAEAAARMGDEIAHGFGLMAMIAGAVAGAVIGAAVVAATAATGGLAAVIIAGAIAGGGLAAGQIMSGLTTIFNLPEPTSGVVATGSFNVMTNMRPAVRALLDVAACSGIPMNHPPLPMPVPLVEGSATVLINNMPASRLKSKLMCGAHMKSGSNNVVIGGETARVGFCFDLESWFKTGLEILGIGALIGGALFAAAAGLAAFASFAAITGGAMAVFEGLGRIGDALGPGYRDLLQGVAGMGLLVASPRIAKLGAPKAPVEVVETPPPVSSVVAEGVVAETAAVRPLNPSTRFYVSETGEVLDAKTYARNSGFRSGVRDEAWANAVDPETGLVKDPLTQTPMDKDAAWDMGHKPGMEYWKERDAAINDWLDNRNAMPRSEFLDRMNDPSRYRPELPSSNRSHKGEDLTDQFFK